MDKYDLSGWRAVIPWSAFGLCFWVLSNAIGNVRAAHEELCGSRLSCPSIDNDLYVISLACFVASVAAAICSVVFNTALHREQ